MATESNLNYEKFEPSYDKNLNRKTGFEQPPRPSIHSPFDLGPRTVTNQTFNDLWIQNLIQSTNYKPQITGFQIDGRKGEIECKKIFTQDLNIGNRTIYVDVGGDIQQAIDNVYNSGGGRVILKNGTHTPGYSPNVRNHVYIEGQSADGCIVDFQLGAYGFQFTGTLLTSAGTVSIANGSVLVNGVLTNFTTDMIGDYILLSGIWYLINAVLTTTQLTISLPYGGVTIAGGACLITTPLQDTKISTLTIKNTTAAAIYIRYVNEFFTYDVSSQVAGLGFDVLDSSNIFIQESDNIYPGIGMRFNNVHFTEIKGSGSIDSTSDSFVFNNCSSSIIYGNYLLNSADAGVKIEDCEDLLFLGVTSIEAGGYGWELLGDNTDIVMQGCGARNGASDGFNLAGNTDYCKIIGGFANNNTSYGVNVSVATCNYNQIALNTLRNNTTGTYQDLGTNTSLVSNIP